MCIPQSTFLLLLCLLLSVWVSDYQHTPVFPLCLLVSGTKHLLTLLFYHTFFNLFIIFFGWYDSPDRLYKLLKYTALRRIVYEISYHVVCGAPFYIPFILTDMISDEK